MQIDLATHWIRIDHQTICHELDSSRFPWPFHGVCFSEQYVLFYQYSCSPGVHSGLSSFPNCSEVPACFCRPRPPAKKPGQTKLIKKKSRPKILSKNIKRYFLSMIKNHKRIECLLLPETPKLISSNPSSWVDSKILGHPMHQRDALHRVFSTL